MSHSNFSPQNVHRIFQQAVDNAIEQHRINGQAIAQSDDNGNVQIIQPEDIPPLSEKIKQRQQSQATSI